MDTIIELTRGVPPTKSFAVDKLSICAHDELVDYAYSVLQYSKAYGFLPLREKLAETYHSDKDQIITGTGSLQVLDHLLRSFPMGSLRVGVEEPSYDRTLTLLKRAHAELLPCPLKPEGIDLNVLKKALAEGKKVDFFYVISDFQNPTGSVMPLEKRKELVALARAHHFYIIEDLPYRNLRYNGESVPSCHEMAPDCTCMMSSFSKLIAPGLRVGFMILPPELVHQTAKIAEDTYINPSYLDQALVYEFCQKGWLDEHLIFLKDLYGHRRDVMAAALESHLKGLADWTSPDGGFFIGSFVKQPIKAEVLMQHAEKKGLKLTDGRGFYTQGGDQFVRLPFCALEDEQIEEGIARLADTLRSYPG
ncbi:MAG: PLP-dependent aminotransferase family protein [Anaerolineaceae bacterium]|nr:PLP-dependent aminotransferase family protein [Anaerolineaceae bacterium]